MTVCMDSDAQALIGVRPMASAMFASIGVTIDWHDRHSCPVGVGAIEVHLSYYSSSMRNSEPWVKAKLPERKPLGEG